MQGYRLQSMTKRVVMFSTMHLQFFSMHSTNCWTAAKNLLLRWLSKNLQSSVLVSGQSSCVEGMVSMQEVLSVFGSSMCLLHLLSIRWFLRWLSTMQDSSCFLVDIRYWIMCHFQQKLCSANLLPPIMSKKSLRLTWSSSPSTVSIYRCFFLLVNSASFCYCRAALAVSVSSEMVLMGVKRLEGRYLRQKLMVIESGSRLSFFFFKIVPLPTRELNIQSFGAPLRSNITVYGILREHCRGCFTRKKSKPEQSGTNLIRLLSPSFPFFIYLFIQYNLSHRSLLGIRQLGQYMAVAAFGGTPTAKHFSFQSSHCLKHFGSLQDVFFVLLNAALSTIVVYLEGICPLTLGRSRHVVVVTANVDVPVILQPRYKGLVAHFAELGNLHIDDSGLLFQWVFLLFSRILVWPFLLLKFTD